jgi:hypothetical protein
MRPVDWQYSSIHRYIQQGILTPDWGADCIVDIPDASGYKVWLTVLSLTQHFRANVLGCEKHATQLTLLCPTWLRWPARVLSKLHID